VKIRLVKSIAFSEMALCVSKSITLGGEILGVIAE
jgi:hypothetical protein